jgi:general secretion pathway protein A
MYESYYGFKEKPFSLTPDPKYLYRSESHANAFDLLQYAIRRREGFVVVTGDIGTGKTTLVAPFSRRSIEPRSPRSCSIRSCPRRICSTRPPGFRRRLSRRRQERPPCRRDKQELIDALYDFLLSLIPLKASAVLIIDEAQNLPHKVLEQIRFCRTSRPTRKSCCRSFWSASSI